MSMVIEGVINLFELDLAKADGPVLRFCSLADFNRVITRGGLTYTPIPLEVTGFEYRANGALPQPTVAISNVFGGINILLNDYGELLGCPVKRIRTLEEWLDDGANPDPNAALSEDQFVIAQKMSHTPIMVVFRLATEMDQEGTKLPRRSLLRDTCMHIYRREVDGEFNYDLATCPYVGVNMWDVFDQVTTNMEHDQCSRRLLGCQNRFPNQPLPMFAFPSVGKVRG